MQMEKGQSYGNGSGRRRVGGGCGSTVGARGAVGGTDQEMERGVWNTCGTHFLERVEVRNGQD